MEHTGKIGLVQRLGKTLSYVYTNKQVSPRPQRIQRCSQKDQKPPNHSRLGTKVFIYKQKVMSDESPAIYPEGNQEPLNDVNWRITKSTCILARLFLQEYE